MLKLKRLMSLVTAVSIVLSLAACSKADKNYGVSSESSTQSEDVSSVASVDETPAKIMSLDRVMSTYFDISLFDEENYSEIYLDKKFKIDAEYAGAAFTVPCKIADLEKNGWKLSEENEYGKGSLIFSHELVKTDFENQNGAKLTAYFYNSTRYYMTVSECNIVKFHIDNDFYVNGENYTPFNINGITNTLAITDVIDILGTPSHFYAVSGSSYYLDYFITKKDRRSRITVYVNPEDDAVTAVEFSYYK